MNEFLLLMSQMKYICGGQDYLAVPSTMDLAYNVILEHTIAERERR